LGYDPKFVDRIAPGDWRTANLEQLVSVLCHEVMHVALLHPIRIAAIPDVDLGLANRAADLAINPLLKARGYTLPEGHLDEYRFHGMSFEEIYNVLKRERDAALPPISETPPESDDPGEVHGDPEDCDGGDDEDGDNEGPGQDDGDDDTDEEG